MRPVFKNRIAKAGRPWFLHRTCTCACICTRLYLLLWPRTTVYTWLAKKEYVNLRKFVECAALLESGVGCLALEKRMNKKQVSGTKRHCTRDAFTTPAGTDDGRPRACA